MADTREQISVFLEPDTLAWLKKTAEQDGRSVSGQIRWIVKLRMVRAEIEAGNVE